MQNLFDLIKETPICQWHYYFGIDNNLEAKKPFVDNSNYSDFILNYFKKGGKVRIFETSGIEPTDLRLPNHICSVFFLGVLLYYKTSFHKKYKLGNNEPGYSSYPFIWFLIALFHDNAYQMESENALANISSLDDLEKHFSIEHHLLDKKFPKCTELIQSRKSYFLFRLQQWKLIDHGILGGLLLFDRLVKIRREKKLANEDNLFWGKSLEYQYKLAANAISIHNIWLPTIETQENYKKFGLDNLINFKPVKFRDFPFFYILGIVDTIEPLKTYQADGFSDKYILENLSFDFRKSSLVVSNNINSKLDFNKLIAKTIYFENWLDIGISTSENSFELTFNIA